MRATILVLLLFALALAAWPGKALALQPEPASGLQHQPRGVDSTWWAELTQGPEFDYHREDPQEATSLWEQVLFWLDRQLSRLLVSEEGAYPWVRWAIILLAASFLIIKLLGMDLPKIFFRNKAVLDFEALEKDLENQDLGLLLAQQEAQGSFREAIRLLFLQALKALAQRELIRWSPEKTNAQYADELLGHPLAQPFALLVRDFDFAWYGEFPVREGLYRKVKAGFLAFEAQLETFKIPAQA